MKQRCGNPDAANYSRYGARGIAVCDEWQRFPGFIADMGQPPTVKHTLDRIDNNLGYSKANCRWATVEEQQNNRRDSVIIEAFGEKMTLAQWCRKIKITRDMVRHRIFVLGMKPEEAFIAPKMSHVKKIVRKIVDGKIVATYLSLADAGRAEGVDKRVIWNALAGKNKTAMGCQWRYEG